MRSNGGPEVGLEGARRCLSERLRKTSLWDGQIKSMECAWDAAGRRALERPGPQKSGGRAGANDDARSLRDLPFRLTTFVLE
jgi:hypothetical protein